MASPAPAPELSLGKKVLFTTVVSLGALILGVALLRMTVLRPGGRTWQAAVMMEQLDCSVGGICRRRPGTLTERDATGNERLIRINSIGFRGPEPLPDTPGRLTAQVYGDSMVFGTGVEDDETLPAALAAALSEGSPGIEAHGANFGLPMNYLRSNLLAYEHFGRQYRPDVVIFCWTGSAVNPRDMNHRVEGINDSALLSWLSRRSWGLGVVNFLQISSHRLYTTGGALRHLRELARPLLEDQRAHGTRVYVHHWWAGTNDDPNARRWHPEALEVTQVPSELSLQAYRESAYCIPGDGHPTPEGHRYYARRIAEVVLGENFSH